MADWNEDDDFNGPRTATNLTGRASPMYSCKPCSGSGIVSGHDGRAVYCPRCKGTTRAMPRASERIRASWGIL